MINIFTQDNESTVYGICKWLEHYSVDYNLIFPSNEEYVISICKERKNLVSSKNIITFDSNCLFWYRRGAINFDFEQNFHKIKQEIVKEDARFETFAIKELAYKLIEAGNSFAGIENAELNRLFTLVIAEKNGLKVPDYLTTNSKSELQKFISLHNKIINKPLGNGLFEVKGNKSYSTYTSLFTASDFNKLPAFFFPSLFMKYIDKEYEIRAFFLSGKFYSMAIMSQKSKQTCIDYRKYDLVVPNRNAPYKLPYEIECKLRKVIKHFKLNTCSIDIIFTKNKEFIFLEINPVGQFTFVGYPCNYYLEKKFAQELIRKSNNKH